MATGRSTGMPSVTSLNPRHLEWSMLREWRNSGHDETKREGEKLTGSLSGDDWTVELNGRSSRGNRLSGIHERDGQKIVSKSKGKIPTAASKALWNSP